MGSYSSNRVVLGEEKVPGAKRGKGAVKLAFWEIPRTQVGCRVRGKPVQLSVAREQKFWRSEDEEQWCEP